MVSRPYTNFERITASKTLSLNLWGQFAFLQKKFRRLGTAKQEPILDCISPEILCCLWMIPPKYLVLSSVGNRFGLYVIIEGKGNAFGFVEK